MTKLSPPKRAYAALKAMATVSASMAIAAGVGSSAFAKGHTSSAEPNRPYGAQSIGGTDTLRLQHSLRAQIKSGGLEVPPMDLFPADNAPTQTVTLDINGHVTMVAGIAENRVNASGDTNAAGKLNDGIYAGENRCSSTVVLGVSDAYRVYAALHETTHAVAFELGLNQDVYKALSAKAKPGEKLDDNKLNPVNIKERIADAGAVLYILSNYKNASDMNKFTHAALLDRQVFTYTQENIEHVTTSSMVAAIKAFRAHPKHGMTIIETTRVAADIIKKQPLSDFDLKVDQSIKDALDNGVNPREFDPLFHKLEPKLAKLRDQRIVEATKARNAYCRVGPRL